MRRTINKLPIYVPVVLFAVLLITGSLLFQSFTNKALAARDYTVQFTSHQITTEDTLWSIARMHYNESYGSIEDYQEEIARCNHLTSDSIEAGASLVIPVYVSNQN